MYEDFIPQEKRLVSIVREAFDWLESGLTAVICVVLVFTFVARMVSVVGESMEPTLQSDDRLIATRLYGSLNREDIVVVTKPNEKNNEPLIKRVVAVEGQVIDIDFETGTVYIDGVRQFEPYIAEPTHTKFNMEFPQVVPWGCVFVMGDNRNHSWDSRDTDIGMVDDRHILGKVIFRVMPYESFGRPK